MTAPPIDPPRTCIHRWLLDSPDGPTVRGVCRDCGTARQFRSSAPSDGQFRLRSPRSLQGARPSNRSVQVMLQCGTCGAPCPGPQALASHLRRHSEDMLPAISLEGRTPREAMLAELHARFPDGHIPFGVIGAMSRRYHLSRFVGRRILNEFLRSLAVAS